MTTTGTESLVDTRSTEILRLVFQHRRLLPGHEKCARMPCDGCFAPHLATVQTSVAEEQPIHFVIPAFPAKSPNRTKVLGKLPDLGEHLALDFLQSICDHITHYHPPGAMITICSDGHVFGDVVGVSDDDITAYRDQLQHHLTTRNFDSLRLYGLQEALLQTDYVAMREHLETTRAEPLDQLRQRIATDHTWRSLFNGIHRFMFEDQLALNPDRSRTRVREDSKELAYAVIRRSNAWSRIVAEQFPSALRLSIHPQPAHAEKIGIHMVRTKDAWLTPWHGVVLDNGTNLSLVKRADAEQLGASLIHRGGHPSHFVAPWAASQEAPTP